MADNPSPLKWIYEIYDKMSGPAKNMATALGSVEKALDKTTIATQKLESAGGSSITNFAGKFALIFTAVTAAVEITEKLIGKMFELGVSFTQSAFEAAGFEQQSKIAFEVLTGSAKAGNEVLEETKRFALDAALPLKTVEQAYRNLLLGGVRKENIGVILSASADIANIQGTGAGGAASLAQTFADIQSKGQLTGRSLLQFQGALDFNVLAEKLGHAGVGFRGLQKILSEAPVSADKGIPAILAAIADKTGAVGTVTQRFANTIPGIIERVKTGWEEILGGLADSPTFDALTAKFSKLAEFFDPFTEKGKHTQELVGRLLDQITDLIDKLLSDPKAISRFFESATDSAGTLLRVIEPLSRVAGGIADAFAGAGLVLDKIKGKGPKLEELSPELNAPTGEDLPKITGHYATGGIAAYPQIASVAENEPEAIIPLSKLGKMGGGGATIQITQNISVSGGGSKRDAEETGHIIAKVSQGDLQSALESMALSLGLA